MPRKKSRRTTPRKNLSPFSGRMTAVPSRSLVDRHARRRVKATDFRSFRSKPLDLRPLEDLRRVPQEIDKRSVHVLRDGRKADIVRREQGLGKVSVPRMYTPMHDYFSDPERTLVCIRRHDRRRVLFALRKAGKGKRVSRERNFTDKSFVRCK